MMKTIFERIIDGEIEAEKVFEDEDFIVIKDKYPKAPVHLLLITKKVIPSLQSLEPADVSLVAKVFPLAQKLAAEFEIDEGGYRLLVNNGSDAGQTIFHLHFHLLGGRPLGLMG